MPIDPLSTRNLAAAFAVGGLVTMMIAPEPSWHSVVVGISCLLAFGGLSLVPSRKPVRRQAKPRRPETWVMRETRPGPVYRMPALPPPASRGPDDPHPVLFLGMRTRRSGQSD
ncbi:hypothetical protein [Methylobacterium sp.]|jgi:hypothetical protein|uniref:hypothetical protein n=1 Tax=Methylobacterium sp. TaxID=409 RepID=UPI0026276B5B|nr:hypothetical protein [Methylobacterium sp.]MDB5644658.1 hypothetical protein [Methylobacterium sp.]